MTMMISGDSRASPAVILSTLADRLRAKVDTQIHPPPSSRILFDSAREAFGSRDPRTTGPALWAEADLVAGRLHSDIEARLREVLPNRFDYVHAPEGGWSGILESLYVLVRLVRPATVVETGVGIVGASTAFILQALSDSGCGRLISIDPDRFAQMYGFNVGAGIPSRLRSRHKLVQGESRRVLREVLDGSGDIEMFLHDGCHTYSNMTWEFEVTWPHILEGGWLLSDDTVSSSLDDFCRTLGQVPVHVKYNSSSFGVVRKRSIDRSPTRMAGRGE